MADMDYILEARIRRYIKGRHFGWSAWVIVHGIAHKVMADNDTEKGGLSYCGVFFPSTSLCASRPSQIPVCEKCKANTNFVRTTSTSVYGGSYECNRGQYMRNHFA